MANVANGDSVKGSRASRTALIVAAAALGAGVAPGGAHANLDDAVIGGYVDGTAATQYSGVEASVGCAPGLRAVGGGIVQVGSATDLLLRASGPLDETATVAGTRDGDKPRGWYAAASNETAGPVDFRVFVVCAEANVTLEVKRFSMGTGDGKGASAECPGSRRAVAGGVIQGGAYGGSFVREAGPTVATGSFADVDTGARPRGWRGVMHNQGGSAYFKTLAVCAPDADARLRVRTLRLPRAVTTTTGFANCDIGQRALGGGVLHNRGLAGYYSGTPTGPLDPSGATIDTEVGDVPTRWFGGLNNILGEPAAKLKIATVCV